MIWTKEIKKINPTDIKLVKTKIYTKILKKKGGSVMHMPEGHANFILKKLIFLSFKRKFRLNSQEDISKYKKVGTCILPICGIQGLYKVRHQRETFLPISFFTFLSDKELLLETLDLVFCILAIYTKPFYISICISILPT